MTVFIAFALFGWWGVILTRRRRRKMTGTQHSTPQWVATPPPGRFGKRESL